MFINIILYSVIIAIYLITHISKKYDNETKNKAFLFLVFLFFFLLIAFRDESMGNDTVKYLDTFSRYAKTRWNSAIFGGYYEPGYVIFNILVSFISTSRRVFLLITAFLITNSTYRLIKKYSQNYFISCLLFVGLMIIFTAMNTTRQYIALSIILYAIPLAEKRRLIPFMIAIAIAISIHTSAVFGILIYIIFNIKFTKKKSIIILLASTVGTSLVGQIYTLIMSAMGRPAYLIGRVGTTSIINFLFFALYLCIFIILEIKTRRTNTQNIKNNPAYLYSVETSSAVNLAASNMNTLSRADDYFSIIAIAGIPSLIENSITRRRNRILFYVILISTLFITSSTIITLRPEWNTAYNYIPCFSTNSTNKCFP